MTEHLTAEQKAINKLIDAVALIDRTQGELIKVMADMDRRLSALEGKAKKAPVILDARGMRAN